MINNRFTKFRLVNLFFYVRALSFEIWFFPENFTISVKEFQRSLLNGYYGPRQIAYVRSKNWKNGKIIHKQNYFYNRKDNESLHNYFNRNSNNRKQYFMYPGFFNVFNYNSNTKKIDCTSMFTDLFD